MSEARTLAGAGAAHLALIAALSLAWARMDKPALPPPDAVAVDLVNIADVPTRTAEARPATAPPTPRVQPEPEAVSPPAEPEPEPEQPAPAPHAKAARVAPPEPEPKPVPQPVAEEPAPKPKPPKAKSSKAQQPVPNRDQIAQSLDKLLAKPTVRPAPKRADPTQLASLLDKAIARAPTHAAAKPGPTQTAQPANAALDRLAAATLQQSIAGQIARCWNVAPGTQDMTVDLHVFLAKDGSVAGAIQTIGVTGGANSGIERSFADSAKRAVLQCAPLKLPAASYSLWRELIPLHLDPKDIR